MKWFTRKWATGQHSEGASKAVMSRYFDHLNSILMHLTEDVDDDLIVNVNIHDGHVKRWRQTDDSIELEIVAGDLQSGYKRILLTFGHATLTAPPSIDELNLGHPRTELLYDEFDVVSEDIFEYRVLVWPTGELVIQFRSLKVQISDAAASDW